MKERRKEGKKGRTHNDDKALEWRGWREPEHWYIHKNFWLQVTES